MNFIQPASRLDARALSRVIALALALGAAAPLPALSWFHRKPKAVATASAAASASAPIAAPASVPAAASAASAPAAIPVAPDPTAAQLTTEAQAAYQRGELARAGKLFAKASALDPNNAATAYNAGIFFFQAREPDKAAKYFHRALKRNPDHALAHYYLGLIAEKAGNYDDAIREYGEAARRDRRVLDAGYNKEVVQSRLTMDVRLRRYLDGDRPLDFAAVNAPGELPPPKPEAKPKPKPEAKPAPRPEIRIDTKAPTPAPGGKKPNGADNDGTRPGDHRRGRDAGRDLPAPGATGVGMSGRGTGGTDHKPGSTADSDPANTDDDYPPPPPVPPPERHEPDIDRP